MIYLLNIPVPDATPHVLEDALALLKLAAPEDDEDEDEDEEEDEEVEEDDEEEDDA